MFFFHPLDIHFKPNYVNMADSFTVSMNFTVKVNILKKQLKLASENTEGIYYIITQKSPYRKTFSPKTTDW